MSEAIKHVLYSATVACYVGAGACEAIQGHAKMTVVALGFAALNAVIFFWR